MDVAALAQYLTHTLRSGQALDLLLLKELVSVMTVRCRALGDCSEQRSSNCCCRLGMRIDMCPSTHVGGACTSCREPAAVVRLQQTEG